VAFERLLVPFVAERVIALDDDVVVVDKPPGMPTHGGDESVPGDVVRRLAAWLRSRGEADYLGVHQRLDLGTSGVLFFTRRAELNAGVAREMEAHQAKRNYVAAIALDANSRLARSGRLEHQLETLKGHSRVVVRGGRIAVVGYELVQRSAERALVELRPETGRTHQLRVQLAAAGAPVAGDADYGGPPAWRVMLHARALELRSLARSFRAEAPPDFAAWVRAEEPSLGSPERVARLFADAGCLRQPFADQADAFRLVNDLGDGLPGVVVDRYGDFAVLEVSSAEAEQRSSELAERLVEYGARGVYLKIRRRADARRLDAAELAPAQPIAGEAAPDSFEVREGRLRFLVRLAEGAQTGLFLDQRANRGRLLELAAGARVLNLFSYTCAFSLAAAAGGAAHVTSVDVSRRALDRGRELFRLNGIDPEAHRFFQADVSSWLNRAARRGELFDLVILDPPSFSARSGRAAFSAEHGYAELAARVLRLVAPGGRLLAVTNHRKTSRQRFRRLLHEAVRASGRNITELRNTPVSPDFPERLGEPFPSKSALVGLA
jgi:23S rRNA (cytosine1962-C5)-methyltransferase